MSNESTSTFGEILHKLKQRYSHIITNSQTSLLYSSSSPVYIVVICAKEGINKFIYRILIHMLSLLLLMLLLVVVVLVVSPTITSS